MIYFDDKRDFVRVFSGDRAENAVGRSDGVAAAFDGEFDDIFRIEKFRIRRKTRACRMFDALIDGQNRKITRSRQVCRYQKATASSAKPPEFDPNPSRRGQRNRRRVNINCLLKSFGLEYPKSVSASSPKSSCILL